MPFDETVFDKPLDSSTKTRTQKVKKWVSDTVEVIKCCFRSGGCKK